MADKKKEPDETLDEVLTGRERFNDESERRQYEASLKEYWDYTSTLDTAADNRAKKIAREMKADNMPIELIAKYTGLTLEEIEGL